MCNGQLQFIKKSFFAPLKIDIRFQVCLQFGLKVVDATDITFCNDNDTCSFLFQCIFMCHTKTHQSPYVDILCKTCKIERERGGVRKGNISKYKSKVIGFL